MLANYFKHRYILVLNPAWGRCEDIRIAASADTAEELQALLAESAIEGPRPYEGGLYRTYARDTPLYDCNPPQGKDQGIFDVTDLPWLVQRKLNINADTAYLLRKKFGESP